MTSVVATHDRLAAGSSALREYFVEGSPALEHALPLLKAVEPEVRGSGDDNTLTLWLLALATALRYTRRPEPMDDGLQRARELTNLVARTQGEAATIPYRTLVEGIYRDLADVVPRQAETYLVDAMEYSERTVRLARQSRRDDWLAAALASRADLVLRQAGADRRSIRRAVSLHDEARRRWPSRDREGRAQAALDSAGALLAAGEPEKAELLTREALAVFTERGDRYHQAAAHLTLARALFVLDRDEALDEQAAAVALYRALGCPWELRRAEGALA